MDSDERDRILVTGGTGTLGRALVPSLRDAGLSPVVLSRKPTDAVATEHGDTLWVQGNLVTGEGLPRALDDVTGVVHAATVPARRPLRHDASVDVGGTRNLIEACRAHPEIGLLYVSIVGIDEVPTAYYRSKIEAERVVSSSDLRWSILRSTQFHPLIDAWLRRSLRRQSLRIPKAFRFQPVEPAEVAQEIVGHLLHGDEGRLEDFGGPEVAAFEQLAEKWIRIQQLGVRIKSLPALGKAARAMSAGALTTSVRNGTLTWGSWLEQKYLSRRRTTASRETDR